MSCRVFLVPGSLLGIALLAACAAGDDPTGTPVAVQAPTQPGTSTPLPAPAPAAAAPAPTATGGEPAAPATPPVRFVAMGDTGTGENGQIKIGNAIAAKCAKDGCDFVQLLGDNLYPSGAASTTDPIWQERFEIPYAAVNLPFYVVLGNHDYGGDGAGTDFPKGKNEIDYTAVSTKWKLPAAHYKFAKGPAEFFALDTNMAMFGQAGAQKGDVLTWLADSKAKWKIAFGHHPYKSNGDHGNAGKYDNIPIPGPWTGKGVKEYLEQTICGRADVYFSGHDHSQQWLNESCNGTELAVSGAGAKTTELPGTNATLFQSLELGFLYVVVEDKKLTAQFIDENGNVEFTHTISKP